MKKSKQSKTKFKNFKQVIVQNMPQMLFQYTTLQNNPYLARSGLHSNLDDSDSGIYCQLHR